MLILARKVEQRIQIGRDITITVLKIRNGTVKVGIEAPKGTSVFRTEVLARRAAAQATCKFDPGEASTIAGAPHGADAEALPAASGSAVATCEEDDERLARVRKRLAQVYPLAQSALEKAALSVDPDGVLHIALPSSTSVGLVLLSNPERKRLLDEAARAEGFGGGVVLEKKDAGEGDELPPPPRAPESKGEFASKAVDSVRRVFGAQILEVKRAPEPAVEKAHDEPE